MNKFNEILDSYLSEWHEDELSGQFIGPDGWVIDYSVLMKYDEGAEVYKSTIEFITPLEAKLAAFMFDNWSYAPVKHPEDCHCIFCD